MPSNKQPRPNRYRGRKTAKRENHSGGVGTFRKMLQAGKFVFSGAFALVAVALISVGLILGYHWLVNSPYFMVRKVVLNGINRVSRADVLKRTGLDEPANILALRLGPMADNLQGLSWVESVTLTRKLPDTIIVDIRERRPQALISLDSLYYLDATGRPFKKVDPKERPELPVITGFTREDLVERYRFSRQDLDEVFSLLEVLAERNDQFRLENISEINMDPARGISLFTRDNNVQVKIGSGDYRAKFKRLGRVLAHLKIQGQSDDATYFNLECSPRVIVRQAASS